MSRCLVVLLVQPAAEAGDGFFAEIGCAFPPFPYVAHTRGWSAEDMENNVLFVQESEELREGARALVDRALETSRRLLATPQVGERVERAGRKAHHMTGDMLIVAAQSPEVSSAPSPEEGPETIVIP